MADITVSADIHSFMQAADAAAARTVLSAATLGANTFTALQTITQASANAGILASTGYSLTGSNATNMVDLAGTWNTSGAPTAIKLRITNTASNASSLLFDFGTNAAALATLRIDGAMRLLKSYSATNYHIGDASGGISWSGGETFFVRGGGSYVALTSSDGLIMSGSRAIGWTSGNADAGANDALFMRKAAASIQLGEDAAGVTNQMLTAASRITSDGVGANLTISAGNGRGGAGGNLIFASYTTGGAATIGTLTTRLTLDAATGHLIPGADATYNLGSSTANFANIYSAGFYSGSTQVLGAQGAAVTDASGGATVDDEARTAINTLLSRLRTHGLIAT